jgi:hypothetical protein
MACSLSIEGRQYPCAKAVGGLKKIFFSAFVEGGILVPAGEATNGTWYGYDLRGASSVETAINGSRENNSIFYTQTVSIQLPLLDEATQDEIKLLAAARPHIVVEDYNGQQMVIGLENGADLTGGSLATGANMGDYSGFTLTFEALEKNPPTFLTTAVTDSAGPGVITPVVTVAS